MVAIPRLDDLSLAVTVDIRGEPRQRSVALPDVRGAPLGHIFGAVPPVHDHPQLSAIPPRLDDLGLAVTVDIRGEPRQRSVALPDVRGAPLGHIFGAVPPVNDHPQLVAIPPRLH